MVCQLAVIYLPFLIPATGFDQHSQTLCLVFVYVLLRPVNKKKCNGRYATGNEKYFSTKLQKHGMYLAPTIYGNEKYFSTKLQKHGMILSTYDIWKDTMNQLEILYNNGYKRNCYIKSKSKL